MFAAVDLGSNSFRLHVGCHDGDVMRIVRSARDPIRLGAGLDYSGNLTETAIQRAIDSLTGFKSILAGYSLNAVRVVATNTIRVASNSASFLPIAEKAIGYPIDIISGEEEGRLIYMGVASTLVSPTERRLVLDIGGGSTEIIVGMGQEIEQVESFSIGTVRTGQTFFGDGYITEAGFSAAIVSTRSLFEDAAPSYRPENWSVAYGSSGTLRAIGDAITKNGIGDGALSLASLHSLRRKLIEFGHINQIVLTGVKTDRTAVIVGGLAVLIGIMQELGIESIVPIEAGLRMGVLWDLHLRATQRDRREQSVRLCLQRFHGNETRANRVAEYASRLLISMKPIDQTLTRYVYWSGLLHEVGLAVSHTGYHKHGAYLVEHADMPGFTAREQQLMASLILGQKGNLRKVGNRMQDLEFARALLALRLAILFSHGRTILDETQLRLKMKTRIELTLDTKWLTDHPTVSFWIRKEQQNWQDLGVEFVVSGM
jgi:exopolyphosphatase/guanosine-5'-triphosphate,3'-diphosphate pyrophosphatase